MYRIANTNLFSRLAQSENKVHENEKASRYTIERTIETITEIQATQSIYMEKQREAEELATDIKRHAVACKRKFVSYCDALRKNKNQISIHMSHQKIGKNKSLCKR